MLMGKPTIEKQDSVKMYKLRKTLEELSDKSGRGTELISLYIPPKKALHEVINGLREEQGTADNIKSDLTRTHVVDALSRVIQRLKLYKKPPDKGLVVFCGALPAEGGGPIGSEVIKLYKIEPQKELNTFLYRGDDHFNVNFIKEEYLEYRLQNMIIATLDTSYAGSEGVREAFARAQEVLSDYRMVEEKKLVEKLFHEIHFSRGLAVYGLKDIIDLLKKNVVSLVLITDDTNLRKLDVTCKRCQNVQTEILERPKLIQRTQELLSTPCPNCKSMDSEAAERDIVDYLALVAGETGAKVEVISGSTEHGTMLSSIGKVGAFLRYNPNQ